MNGALQSRRHTRQNVVHLYNHIAGQRGHQNSKARVAEPAFVKRDSGDWKIRVILIAAERTPLRGGTVIHDRCGSRNSGESEMRIYADRQ